MAEAIKDAFFILLSLIPKYSGLACRQGGRVIQLFITLVLKVLQ